VTRNFIELVSSPPDLFNPILTTNTTSMDVAARILPRLLDLDPETGAPAAVGLAESWVWASDSTAITMTLRSGVVWSDGVPVTSSDVGFTYAALANPETNSPHRDRIVTIDQILIPDEQTVVFRLNTPDCALTSELTLPILPSHLFAADQSDLRTNAWNQSPTVGAGAFLYQGRDEQGGMVLKANPSYWKGAPQIEGYIMRVEPDAAQRLRLVQAGEADFAADVAVPQAEVKPGLRLERVARDGLSMLAMNLADPLLPQPGQGITGTVQPQVPHPVLGDQQVRWAIAQAVPWGDLVRQVYGDDAAPLVASVPSSIAWAHEADLPPYAWDPAQSARLLEQAGWVDAAADGVRERGDALLQLTLLTNDDNAHRISLADRIAAELRKVGFAIQVEALPFDRVSQVLFDQGFDLALVGWEALGADPAAMALWHSGADQPGSGVNVFSYQNAQVDARYVQAAGLPGCSLQERGALYQAIQRTIYDEAPAIPLNAQTRTQAVGSRWQGVSASPWSTDWMIETWSPIEEVAP
jgi:peptide/nickel transport system substrate-binding protein